MAEIHVMVTTLDLNGVALLHKLGTCIMRLNMHAGPVVAEVTVTGLTGGPGADAGLTPASGSALGK